MTAGFFVAAMRWVASFFASLRVEPVRDYLENCVTGQRRGRQHWRLGKQSLAANAGFCWVIFISVEVICQYNGSDPTFRSFMASVAAASIPCWLGPFAVGGLNWWLWINLLGKMHQLEYEEIFIGF